MSDDFWKHEEELDKKFNKKLEKEIEKLSANDDPLTCSEKCVNNIGNTCVTNDWECRLRLDRKEMKLH